MDEIRKKIFLGALLHDMGKFYQRGDKTRTRKPPNHYAVNWELKFDTSGFSTQ